MKQLLLILGALIALPLCAPAQNVNVTNPATRPVPVAIQNALPVTVSQATAQRTPTITTATTSGSVSAGARKVTFILSSDFAGTILGATVSGATDSYLTIDAPAGDTLAAVAYTRTAGSVRIVEVR